MVCFQTKNPNLGKFCRALYWKMLTYFMAIWNILWRFGIFYDHFVHFLFIWYIFPVLVSCAKKNLATLIPSYMCTLLHFWHFLRMDEQLIFVEIVFSMS
jgi:hypothetical protein